MSLGHSRVALCGRSRTRYRQRLRPGLELPPMNRYERHLTGVSACPFVSKVAADVAATVGAEHRVCDRPLPARTPRRLCLLAGGRCAD
eukprot:2828103-Prymnesium_polylepis.1